MDGLIPKLIDKNFIYEYILCVLMTSINIAIKKEAYDFLKDIKARDMSFSDVILSFKKDQNNAMRFFGVLKDLDLDKKKEEISNLRKSFNKRLQ